METPIQIAVINEGYGRYMAFVTTDFSSLCDASTQNEAIVDALTEAGIIKVVNVTEERRAKREAERKAEMARLAAKKNSMEVATDETAPKAEVDPF